MNQPNANPIFETSGMAEIENYELRISNVEWGAWWSGLGIGLIFGAAIVFAAVLIFA